jgi:hypothetical protein
LSIRQSLCHNFAGKLEAVLARRGKNHTLGKDLLMKAVLSAVGCSIALWSGSLWAGADVKHPCKTLKSACEAAGYYKGGHKQDNKGLWKDCMQPLLDGKTVAGVSADAAVVAACKEKKADHPQFQK